MGSEVDCCLYYYENDAPESETDIRFGFRRKRNPISIKITYRSFKVSDLTLTSNDLEEVEGHPEHVTSESDPPD